MTKKLGILAVLAILILAGVNAYAAPAKIKVIVRGEPLTMDSEPVVQSGRTLVPMRDIFESLDAYVEWDGKTKSITATRNGKIIKLKLGDKTALIDGAPVIMDVEPKIIKGKTLVPLRFIGESFGADVNWDNASRTIKITTENFVEKLYNSSGNITNGGFVCSNDGYDYVSFYNLGTFKIKNGSQEKIKINNNYISFINIVGDWIYFANSDQYPVKDEQSRLYKMKTNGNSFTKVTSDKVSYVNIVDDWIYYVNESDYDKPYKIRLDGNGRQKISDESVSDIVVSNGWIYYESDGNLGKMRTNGKDESVLCEEITGNINLNKTKDELFFSINNDEGKEIYEISTDGESKKKVADITVDSLNYQDGWLYFNDFDGNLLRMKEDGSEKKKVGNGVKGNLNISGDWIYFTVYSKLIDSIDSADSENENSDGTNDSQDSTDSSKLTKYNTKEYRIKTDGSIKQKMDKDGLFQDMLTYIPGSTSPTPMPITVTAIPRPENTMTPKDIAKNTDAILLIKTFDEDDQPIASGTGFNIEPSGIVVTNYHVIKDASIIKCSVNASTTYDVDYVLNYNVVKDIAILKLKNTSNLPVVRLGDSDKVELAEDVVAIGNPLELQNSVSTGIVSGLRDMFGVRYIQTSAAISPGNSGGPLFNEYGEVIGITAMTISDSQNLNFAVPINSVKKLFPSSSIMPIYAVSSEDSDLEEAEPNNAMDTANIFAPDHMLGGDFKDSKDVDYYKFTLASKTKVIIVGLSEASFMSTDSTEDLSISLLDQNGNEITKSVNKTETDYNTQNITTELNPGTYYILAKPVSNNKNTASKQKASEYALVFVTD
ncbi:MAG: DUF5050 domain-containing protein [Bacillota bacterium]|nr:DUF5050 domain-containing protein [Bacillota bacterium]